MSRFVCYLLAGVLWWCSIAPATIAQTSAASSPADAMLQKLTQKLAKAKDYSVEANIKTDLPFIKIMPVNATLYFKQKNKFRIVSKSIAVLPRQNFQQISQLLAQPMGYTALASGSEKIGSANTTIINIIPNADTSDLVLGKLWIDGQQNLLLKSQLTTRSNGTVSTTYTYGTQAAYGLPDQLVFTVNMKKFKIPKGVATDLHTSRKADPKEKERKNGQIYVRLSNYQVNKGISDAFFQQKK